MPVVNSAFGNGAAGLGGSGGTPFVFNSDFLAGDKGGAPSMSSDFLSGAPEVAALNPQSTQGSLTPEAPISSTAAWTPAPKGDGLAIDADGRINLHGLRDQQDITFIFRHTREEQTEENPYPDIDTLTLVPVPLRMTVAIPCDHRVTKAVRLAVDPGDKGNENFPAIADTPNDSDRIASNFTRHYFSDVSSLYRKQIRKGGLVDDTDSSYPIPSSVPGVAGHNFYRPGSIADDSDLLEAHAREKAREMCRLDRGNNLGSPHILDVVEPGDMIESFDNGWPLRACVQAVHYQFEGDGDQVTTRVIA